MVEFAFDIVLSCRYCFTYAHAILSLKGRLGPLEFTNTSSTNSIGRLGPLEFTNASDSRSKHTRPRFIMTKGRLGPLEFTNTSNSNSSNSKGRLGPLEFTNTLNSRSKHTSKIYHEQRQTGPT